VHAEPSNQPFGLDLPIKERGTLEQLLHRKFELSTIAVVRLGILVMLCRAIQISLTSSNDCHRHRDTAESIATDRVLGRPRATQKFHEVSVRKQMY
jgi:hypothetical protein